ncbi:MAG: hypothetical protein AMXMBFR61_17950 [Fimbriimonadales bacterium]
MAPAKTTGASNSMSERERAELKLFLRTLGRAGPIVVGLSLTLLSAGCLLPMMVVQLGGSVAALLVPVALGFAGWTLSALLSRANYRFQNSHYKVLWDRVQDRVRRFERAYRKSPRVLKETLSETPDSVHRLVDAMYLALLRADAVRHMLEGLEPWDAPVRGMRFEPPALDEQARTLYDLARKSRSDYREQYQKMLAGVERTEAQVDLLVSSLDNLRLRLLDHRVTGSKVEMPSDELIESLQRHQSELTALEKAVDEVDLLTR